MLTRGHSSPRLWNRKKKLARLLATHLEINVDGLARMPGQLKSNWSPGLSLTHRSSHWEIATSDPEEAPSGRAPVPTLVDAGIGRLRIAMRL
jgi:hypothetical protein